MIVVQQFYFFRWTLVCALLLLYFLCLNNLLQYVIKQIQLIASSTVVLFQHIKTYLWRRKEAARTDLQAVKNGLRMVCLYTHCHTKTCNIIIVHKNSCVVPTEAWLNSVPAHLLWIQSDTMQKSRLIPAKWLDECLPQPHATVQEWVQLYTLKLKTLLCQHLSLSRINYTRLLNASGDPTAILKQDCGKTTKEEKNSLTLGKNMKIQTIIQTNDTLCDVFNKCSLFFFLTRSTVMEYKAVYCANQRCCLPSDDYLYFKDVNLSHSLFVKHL